MPQKPSFRGKRSPVKQSFLQTHSQPCRNLTQRKRSSQRTSALSLRLPVLFFSGYQHTQALGEMKQQISSQKKEGKRSNPHHICPTEKSKLLSVTRRKPPSTARYNPNQDALHQLPQHQQTIIFRLRTGHCRLVSHLKRIGVKTSAQCPCGEVDQTPEPYIQSCSLHQQARQQIWPTLSLKTKLWVSAGDFFLTSKYASLTGEKI